VHITVAGDGLGIIIKEDTSGSIDGFFKDETAAPEELALDMMTYAQEHTQLLEAAKAQQSDPKYDGE
jgi:shikimate 5-dehydrogenase